jgi:putative SOS response-associated peptidase YedK
MLRCVIMCGWAKLETDVSEIKIAFGIPPQYPTPNFPPSWNVAPTDNLPIVRYDAKARPAGKHSPEGKAGHRTLDLMRWGLIPYWAKDIKIGFSTINAMAETIDTKPVFREAFARRRCIVPIDAFYEWKKLDDGKTKQPYAIALADRSSMGLAGLWETWRSRATNETIRSFSIVTTTPNPLCAELHNRMPVILPPTTWPTWLGEEPAEPDELKSLLVPYLGEMVAWPVSQRVGNVKNNDASLVEPIS